MSPSRYFRAMCVVSATISVLLFTLRVNGVHAQEGPPRSTRDVPSLQLIAAADWAGEEKLQLSGATQRPSRRHTGYLIFGVSMLISGYLSSAALGWLITGMNSYECENEGSRSCERARPLFIPLVGPALAKTEFPGVLSVNFVGAQFVGLVFTLMGALLEPSERSPASTDRMRVRLAAVPLSGGALLGMQLTL